MSRNLARDFHNIVNGVRQFMPERGNERVKILGPRETQMRDPVVDLKVKTALDRDLYSVETDSAVFDFHARIVAVRGNWQA